EGWRHVFGNITLNGEKGENGEMTPFQSIATAIAAQVGTGNLTGAATALVSGGPGAIFWMWLSAFFGMATIYAEAVLAQNYKVVEEGELTGGPVYYIKAAFKGKLGKVLAAAFAVFIIIALGFMGNMVQSNSVGTAFAGVFNARGINISSLVIGVAIAIFAAVVFIGGTTRLASVTEKIVPIMAVIYIVGSVIILVMNASAIPGAFKMIFVGAFKPSAIMGGTLGVTVQQSIRYGVARGLFSNEAGMGSTPHAHARAKAKNPHEQGLAAMISVFIDTFVILSITAVTIICTGVLDCGKTGIALTQTAFVTGFGSFGDIFIAVCLFFFAFSTIISWHFFGMVNVKYLFGKKAVKLYSVIVVICIVIGSALKVDLVWEMADFFNGIMVIPNVLALVALGAVVKKIFVDNDGK
ncbi:MAG: alanine:cation symporter family protein, partial [Clostridiales bacterium]|nr:alanine:cation symporter family protein [Clostridiales bacterium]